jgi:hypothetical protein
MDRIWERKRPQPILGPCSIRVYFAVWRGTIKFCERVVILEWSYDAVVIADSGRGATSYFSTFPNASIPRESVSYVSRTRR